MHPVSAPTICLSMIVKNEAHIIKRCLESVRPYIDFWAICDTGSTDGTQQVIRETIGGLPGILREDLWVDFGTNRTMALELAKTTRADYILVIDADELLRVEDPGALARLSADAYRVEMRHAGGISWPRVNLMRGSLNWRYVGIIHEYAQADPDVPETMLVGAHMWTDGDGARGRDPGKALRDLAIMERSVREEPENARYWFYLAQGYEVANQVARAQATYTRRIELGGNPDEVWYSHYRIAQLHVIEGHWAPAVQAYLAAFSADPMRAEPLYWLAQGYIDRKQDALAMVFLEEVALKSKPVGAMFLEEGLYDYLRWVQYAVTAHNLGRTEDAQDIATRLLDGGKAPERYHAVLRRIAGRAEQLEAAAAAGN